MFGYPGNRHGHAHEDRVKRCLEVCEDGCIMSRSVEAGIDVPLEKSHVVED